MNIYLIDLLNEVANYSIEAKCTIGDFLLTDFPKNSKGFKKYLKTLKGNIDKKVYDEVRLVWLKTL